MKNNKAVAPQTKEEVIASFNTTLDQFSIDEQASILSGVLKNVGLTEARELIEIRNASDIIRRLLKTIQHTKQYADSPKIQVSPTEVRDLVAAKELVAA